MKLGFCALCGKKEKLHHHHVQPRVLGGGDEPENILTLCEEHHGMIHKMQDENGKSRGLYRDHQELVKAGVKKAKERGVKFGRKRVITPEQWAKVKALRAEGTSIRKTAKQVGLSIGSTYKCIRYDSYLEEELRESGVPYITVKGISRKTKWPKLNI